MLKQRSQAVLPPGTHVGKILTARETTKDFGRGATPTVEIVIGPDWKQDATTETIPVSVLFTPILNGVSTLSKLLKRLNITVPEGVVWDPAGLDGKRVSFACTHDESGFVKVKKDSLKSA